MNSSNKASARREGARTSTGPKTAEGKSRSRRNAIRHGLRSVTLVPHSSAERVTAIANKLCEQDPFPYRFEVALDIAEAQVMLDRVKHARAFIMSQLNEISSDPRDQKPSSAYSPDNFNKLIEGLRSIDRYERSALGRTRRAIRKFDALRDD